MEQNQIPWENFFRSDSSNMLEDALPYLPPNLKKVAAIYIKLTELSRISTQFDNEQTLSACGFDQNPASMELLLNYQRFVDTTGNHSPSSSNKNSNADLFSKLMPMMMAGDSSSNNHPKPNSDFMNKLNQILKK